MGEPTPSLDEFLAAYREDDNEWWYLVGGDHLNLFDEALDRMAAAEANAEELFGARAEADYRLMLAEARAVKAEAKVARVEALIPGFEADYGIQSSPVGRLRAALTG